MKLRLLLVFVLLCQSYIAFSEVISVTSNADAGVGTLREAITRSNLNGNTEVDAIQFDIPGLTPDEHTIKLLSDLAEITSDVIIDASTQPGQEASLNGGKVIIDGGNFAFTPYVNHTIFKAKAVNRFELYGMVIRNFIFNSSFNKTSVSAVQFIGSNQNVVLGAPGKGNVMYNVYGINVEYDIMPVKSMIHNLVLQNNFIGVKENGIDIPTEINTVSNLRRIYKATIGGNTKQEGNVIYGLTEFYIGTPGELVIANVSYLIGNNIFGANAAEDKPGITTTNTNNYTSINIDANINHQISADIKVTDNVFGSGLSFLGIDNATIAIQRNYFGTSKDRSKKLPLPGQALSILSTTGRILIGGSSTSEGNVFTNANSDPAYILYPGAVTADRSNDIELSHNSFYCNPNIPFLYNYTGPFAKPLEVFLTEKTDSYVAGTTKAGARVELYYTDPECTNCQPKRYFASVNADQSGSWRYDGPLETGYSIIASATANHVSSEFSDPRIYMIEAGRPGDFKVTAQTCDHPNGKIEGAFTVNVNQLEWLDEADNVIGTTADLTDLKAGKYRIKANQFGCVIYSKWVVVGDNIPRLASVPAQLVHPSCGNLGSVLNVYPGYYSALQWLDQHGTVKGSGMELRNVPAGSYTLRITGFTGCIKDFGPYVLTNVMGPAIDQSAADIQGSSCNTPTGSIKNIQVTGSGTLTYKWKNAAGQEVGNAAELLNVPAGLYTLEVKDDSNCPALISTPVEVPEINGITINTANKVQGKATCNSSNGSITGITVTGATDYKWLDAGNTVVASTLNLTGKPAGKYRLVASNAVCDKTSEELTIELAQSTQHYASTKVITKAQCNQDNGKIEVIFTIDQPVGYRWVNSSGQAVGGNSRILDHMFPGTYDLYITDELGCEGFMLQYVIPNTAGVVINPASAMITNDQCGSRTGRIKAPGLSGGQLPYFYEWKDQDGGVAGSGAVLDRLKAGTYQLTIGDAMGCSRQVFSYTVLNESNTLPAPVVNDVKICSAGAASLQVMNAVDGIYTLYNENGSMIGKSDKGVFSLSVSKTEVYSVVLARGTCESAASPVKVTIENDGIGTLANALSPNGDGINDQWVIPGIASYPEATVAIFNRYGYKVFDATGYKTPFNGRLNGAELPVGTYYYIIDLKRGCGLQKGSLTIVR